MSLKGNTTEFSAHLSRSRMARYLQEQNTTQEAKEVELHLLHCDRCSEIIMQYIQGEEPQHYKQYQKKLKGKLKTSETTRKKRLSKTHIKVLRAAAALALLFIFSFFAVKTVMEKNTTGDSTNKAQAKEKREAKQKTSLQKSQKEQDGFSEADNEESATALAMRDKPSKDVNSPKKPEEVKGAKKTVRHDREQRAATTQPKQKTVTSTPNVEKKAETEKSTNEEPKQKTEAAPEKAVTSEETSEVEEQPIVKPLPKLEKLDTRHSSIEPDIKQEVPGMEVPGKEVSGLPVPEENESLLKE